MGANSCPTSSPNGLAPSRLNFNIDSYLNPLILPRKLVLGNLPQWISWWLGYRSEPSPDSNGERKERKRSPNRLPDVYNLVWAAVGVFCTVSALECVFLLSDDMKKHGGVTVASYGAAAILLSNAAESPLTQPRNVFLGQLISSIIGVATTKLFLLIPQSQPHSASDALPYISLDKTHSQALPRYSWLAGALSCALSSAMMGITKTVHPPAGATALVIALQPTIVGLGWWYVVIVIISSTVMLSTTCILNNIDFGWILGWWKGKKEGRGSIEAAKSEWGRRWPLYWWVGDNKDVGVGYKRLKEWVLRRRQSIEYDIEATVNQDTFDKNIEKEGSVVVEILTKDPSQLRVDPFQLSPAALVTISKDSITVPCSLEAFLSGQEKDVLLALQRRIQHMEDAEVDEEGDEDSKIGRLTVRRVRLSYSASSSRTAVNGLFLSNGSGGDGAHEGR